MASGPHPLASTVTSVPICFLLARKPARAAADLSRCRAPEVVRDRLLLGSVCFAERVTVSLLQDQATLLAEAIPAHRDQRHAPPPARTGAPGKRGGPDRSRARDLAHHPPQPASAREDGRHRRRDRGRRPEPASRGDRRPHRGRAGSVRAQRDAGPHRVGVSGAGGLRGEAATFCRGCLARAEDTAHIDPGIRGALPARAGGSPGRPRHCDAPDRQRVDPDGRARR